MTAPATISFTVADGKIAGIDAIADPGRVRRDSQEVYCLQRGRSVIADDESR